MKRTARLALSVLFIALTGTTGTMQSPSNPYVRDPKQPIDEDYTKKIKEYTTEPFFNSPLVDYLPASKTVPTPQAVLGDVAGAPGMLPYSQRRLRLHADAREGQPAREGALDRQDRRRPRDDRGRGRLRATLAKLDENRARLAKLADPRTIDMDDAEADKLVASFVADLLHHRHHPLAGDRRAHRADGAGLPPGRRREPVHPHIRDNVITLITPSSKSTAATGMVDVYNWHLANPGENWPPLVYWGHYVAHDNNRDAMGLTLKLTRNVLEHLCRLEGAGAARPARVGAVPLRQHRRRRSLQRLARSDPDRRVADDRLEQRLGDDQASACPASSRTATFDTWSPGYLMFIAATHNGISRLYETFGNGGADTVERTLRPDEYCAHLVPAESAAAEGEVVAAQQQQLPADGPAGLAALLRRQREHCSCSNFYLKSKRSIEKPKHEGPAAYVFPRDDPRPGAQAELLRDAAAAGLRDLERATVTVTVPSRPQAAREDGGQRADGDDGDRDDRAQGPRRAGQAKRPPENPRPEPRHFPGRQLRRAHGSALQPHRRHAARLPVLGARRSAEAVPTTTPAGPSASSFNVQVVARDRRQGAGRRRWSAVSGEVTAPGGVERHGRRLRRSTTTPTPALADAALPAQGRAPSTSAEEPFEAAGAEVQPRLVPHPQRGRRGSRQGADRARPEDRTPLATAPSVKTHPAARGRASPSCTPGSARRTKAGGAWRSTG